MQICGIRQTLSCPPSQTNTFNRTIEGKQGGRTPTPHFKGSLFLSQGTPPHITSCFVWHLQSFWQTWAFPAHQAFSHALLTLQLGYRKVGSALRHSLAGRLVVQLPPIPFRPRNKHTLPKAVLVTARPLMSWVFGVLRAFWVSDVKTWHYLRWWSSLRQKN